MALPNHARVVIVGGGIVVKDLDTLAYWVF